MTGLKTRRGDMHYKCLPCVCILYILLLVLPAGCNNHGGSSEDAGDRMEVCELYGIYDFGQGDVEVGRVVQVSEDEYLDRITQGDLTHWDVAVLDDGREVCYEHSEVCKLTGTHDFGDGPVPIGEVTKIPSSYYSNHLTEGHPEHYKIVAVDNGADVDEVCMELDEDETQFSSGVALFGYNVDDDIQFVQNLHTGTFGAELSKFDHEDKHHFDAMTGFYFNGNQYYLGVSTKKGDYGYPYQIRMILPSGDMGPITDTGHFVHKFKYVIAPKSHDGKVYIFLQHDGDGNRASLNEIVEGRLTGYALMGPETWHDTWDHYYDTAVALPPNHGRTCFFIHRSHDEDRWCIECINSKGKEYVKDHGKWKHGYQVAAAYRSTSRNKTYLFGHRHRYDWWHAHYKGPWFLQEITKKSKMGSETDNGEWDNYYKSMTVFEHPENNTFYLFGQNTDKHWFLQHVSTYGNMKEETDNGGPWAHYYNHVFPINFDTSYLHSHNWMARLLEKVDGFGERTLRQIALPGSHDSGMSSENYNRQHCHMANDCNTVTQTSDIGGQLSYGARYFDIRPVIEKEAEGSEWIGAGHVQEVSSQTYGCIGEDRESIYENLNNFFADEDHSKELVILKVSHCATNPNWAHYESCSNTKIDQMARDMALNLDQHLVKCDNCNILDMTLNEILSLGNIILVVTSGDNEVRDTANGIFSWGYSCKKCDYYVIDDYTNTEDFEEMRSGQYELLSDYDNHDRDDQLFLLSWTLTLSVASATIGCNFGGHSILDLAAKAEPRLFEYIYDWIQKNKITKTLFPNVLYVDAYHRNATNAAVYLNTVYDDLEE